MAIDTWYFGFKAIKPIITIYHFPACNSRWNKYYAREDSVADLTSFVEIDQYSGLTVLIYTDYLPFDILFFISTSNV